MLYMYLFYSYKLQSSKFIQLKRAGCRISLELVPGTDQLMYSSLVGGVWALDYVLV